MVKDFAHIAPQFRHVLEQSDAERIQFMMEQRWIDYRAGNKLMDILSGLLLVPSRPRMPNIMLVGASNCGKTTLINRFREISGKAYIDDTGTSVRPIIYAEIHKPDERELYNAILENFFAPHNPAAPLAKLRHQAVHLIREARTRMLILDEIHVLGNGSAAKKSDVMNELKMLANTLQIPLVLVGTRLALQLLRLDPQYSSRFDVISIPSWEINADFQRFLKNYESVLPLKEASKLYAPDMATLLHSISGGVTGNLGRLLQECAKDAIQSGAEVIDRRIIEKNQWVRPTDGVIERVL